MSATTIAVASGKGGAGKTTVAVNLAVTAARAGRDTAYLDCDVEEPNGFVFLQPRIDRTEAVEVAAPALDSAKCVGCGQCGRICRYSAVVAIDGSPLLFPELCHGCGGCWLVCKSGAIVESRRSIGRVDFGAAGRLRCVQGVLDVGEAMSPPVIEAVRRAAPAATVRVIDAPPGTSCPAVASARQADFVVLVTEPTPFGLNDLQLAVEMVRALNRPLGVVVNRAGAGDDRVSAWCAAQRIDLLGAIPDDRRVAEAYSRGRLACDAVAEHRRLYAKLLSRLLGERPVHAD